MHLLNIPGYDCHFRQIWSPKCPKLAESYSPTSLSPPRFPLSQTGIHKPVAGVSVAQCTSRPCAIQAGKPGCISAALLSFVFDMARPQASHFPVLDTHQPTHMAEMKHKAAGIIWLQYKKQLTANYNLAEKLFMNHDVRLHAHGKCVPVVLYIHSNFKSSLQTWVQQGHNCLLTFWTNLVGKDSEEECK